jgi:hypothetical protein
MKTILQWYEMLPKDIRDKAIANYDSSFYRGTDEVESIRYALARGFNWNRTPQRWDYWQDVSDNAAAGNYDQPPNTIEQSLSDLTKTLEEMKEAIELVRKAIGNENN